MSKETEGLLDAMNPQVYETYDVKYGLGKILEDSRTQVGRKKAKYQKRKEE